MDKNSTSDTNIDQSSQRKLSKQSVTNSESSQSINDTKTESSSKRNSGQFDGNILPIKQGDSQVPRRLSQLFKPPSEEEIASDDDLVTESSCLLADTSEKKKIVIIPRKSKDEVIEVDLIDRVSIRSSDDNEDKTSNLGSSGQSSNHQSTPDSSSTTSIRSSREQDDEFGNKVADYTSWDDTICSNRSSYFKHYYQKYSSSLIPSRISTRASSHNSLVSLIREKNKMASSIKNNEDDKKKRRENRGLMALVIFLFLVLVIGISLIYHFYNKHLENKALFTKLKFLEDKRLLNLFDSDGNISIQAKVGTTLAPYTKAEDCTHYLQYLYNMRVHKEIHNANGNKSDASAIFRKIYSPIDEFQFDKETVCLDWANQARVQIHRAQTSKEFVNCYNVFWSSHNAGRDLQDCIQISSPKFGIWWGIGDITNGGYPLESVNIPSSPINTGQLGNESWGRILRRVFVSSHGGLLIVPNHIPASVSITKDQLCVAVNVTRQIDKTIPLTLNYTVCASPNVTSTMKYLNHLAGVVDNEKYSTFNDSSIKDLILDRIENPVWIANASNLTQESVLSFADQIISYNESLWGHILLPTTWQSKSGMFKFDPMRFPDAQELSNNLRLKGFELVLTISPLVSTGTDSFRNGTEEGFFLRQSGTNLPVLIRQDSMLAGALTDFTNPQAVNWFVAKIKALQEDFNVNLFHLHPPAYSSIPVHHEFYQYTSNPDLALEFFLKTVSQVSTPFSVDGAIVPPPIPTFVTASNEKSGWDSLASLIPRILTLTMIGFPLVDSGVIGGDPEVIPDEELYTRWTQAATFLPAFQMNVVPSSYSEETRAIVSKCFQNRNEFVIPRLRSSINMTLVANSALISPLALHYPTDNIASTISDEWIIGDDLLVAPILKKGQTSKRIYVPEGMWENQLNGQWKSGPGWATVSVNITDIPFFIKKAFVVLSKS